MKLRNKKTGEIDDFIFEVITDRIDLYRRVGFSGKQNTWRYNSLAELNEEWEDYEEPKVYWFLTGRGDINYIEDDNTKFDNDHKQVGNYFETEEEAEKALEKLKAWKRLKDKGFRFDGYNACSVDYDIDEKYRKYISEDLQSLFGGE